MIRITNLKWLSLLMVVIFFQVQTIHSQTKFPKPKYKVRSTGVPATPDQIKLSQPNGTRIDVYLKGDGAVHWHQTTDGYTLIKGTDGYYEYATQDAKGNLKSSGILANNISQRNAKEIAAIKNIKKGINYSLSQTKTLKTSYLKASLNGPNKAFPANGTRNLLVILIDFPDRTHTFPAENYSNMMNQQGYNGTGSFRDFYLANSFGQLDITSTVVGWYTASNNHDYYCNACYGADPNNTTRELVRDAIDAAEANGIDFSIFDNDNDGEVDGIMVIHQGEGAEMGNSSNIWSHSWTLDPGGTYTDLSVLYDGVLIKDYTINPETRNNLMGTIGVLCHEFGHNLGLPDYYDTDYAESGGDSFDLEQWDCMAQGAHNNNGATPANHNSYSRNLLGWQTAIELTSAARVTLNNSAQFNESYFYSTPTANEFFWVENRQLRPGSFDEFIPGHGMLIYHIDLNHSGWQDNTINVDPTHNAMDIEEADNIRSTTTMTGDPFPGTSNATSFTDLTVVNSNSWAGEQTNKPITSIVENNGIISFDFMGGDPNIPGNFTTSANNSSQVGLSWSLNPNNDPVLIAWSYDGTFGEPVDGQVYSEGSSISGGGTVLFYGNSSSIQHNSLTSNTTYYYRIWSYSNNNNYSSGITSLAKTLCDAINSFPYNEGFESGAFPSCWSQSVSTPSWQFIRGNGSSNPASAHEGTFNACLKDYSTTSNRNMLISPAFDLTEVHSPALTFWHTQQQRGYYYDQLRIYYKTSINDYWHLLETIYTGTTDWTMESINLPNPSSDYYIAFEGDAMSGNGVCIDDISINGCEPPLEQAKDIDIVKAGNNLTVKWKRGSGDSVIVLAKAGSAVDEYPHRGSIYYANSRFSSGSQLGNGNYVIYNGSDTTVTITNIYYNVNYHFAVFEYNRPTLCYATPPLRGNNSLTCLNLRAPITVDFENGFPECWYQEGGSTVWQSLEGNGLTNPTKARGGTLNICLKDNSYLSNTNKLISSPIDITTVSDPTLKFWHTQQALGTNQDELRIYYKTSKNDTWKLLEEYTNSIVEWTMETIQLPEPSSTYYLAFEGNAKGGHGVCIDDVSISVGCEAPTIQASDFSISGLESGNSTLHWQKGNGEKTLVVARSESPVDAYPLDGKSYIGIENYIFGLGEKLGVSNYAVYGGADTSNTIYGLYANQDYYFALFEYNSTTSLCYNTPPFETHIRTPQCNAIEVPYYLDIGVAPPSCWSTDAGSPSWKYSDYNGYEGRYSAYLRDNTTSDDRKMLISPPFDLTTIPDPNLIFWHTQRAGYSYGAQDELRVYYKTSENGSWNLLATYTNNISIWTKEQLILPNPSSEYYIGFEGNAKGGYGVWLDEISIEDVCIPPTTKASNVAVSNVTGNSMTISWHPGDGESSIIIASYGNDFVETPVNRQLYYANSEFGLGQKMGNKSFVVYTGSDTTVNITGLFPGTEYQFRIFEYNNSSLCYLNNPLIENYSTICPSIIYPFTESFESGQISECWTVGPSSYGCQWRIASIQTAAHPYLAHSGDYYGSFTGCVGTSSSNMFISSPLDLSSFNNPTLNFWYILNVKNLSQDNLKIYYRTSATGTWNLLRTYTEEFPEWAEETINLPDPSSEYYVAFEGTSIYNGSSIGFNASIDDIQIYDDCLSPHITNTMANSRCGSGTVALSATSSAGTINWYSSSTGGSPIGTGNNFNTPILAETTTYYVDATENECTTSERTAVTAFINETPTITETIGNSRCGEGVVTLEAVASSGIINWYNALTDGEQIASGSSYTTQILTETTTFYVDATENECTASERTPVTAFINEIPAITETIGNSRCGEGVVTLEAVASSGIINWYNALTDGEQIASGSSYTTQILTETTTFYVDAVENECITPARSSVVATINPFPGKPSLPVGPTELSSNAENQTYQIDEVENATNYIWGIHPLNSGSIEGNGTTATFDINNDFNGAMKLFVIGENDCGQGESSDSLAIVISSSTSTEGITLENNVVIFPNPSSGKIFIKFPNDNTISRFEIIDQSGQIIYTREVNKDKEEIELTISGVYTLRFYNKGNLFSKKIIITD